MAKPARVVVSKDGPYMVTGGPPLSRQTIVTDAEGGSERWEESETFAVRQTYALCRCGHSSNKPFCDGTHGRSASTARRPPSREPYLEQAKIARGAGAVALGCGGPVRLRPLLRPARQRVERGRAYRRADDAGSGFCARCNAARPAAWSPGTMPPASRWSRSCRSRSASSRTRRKSAAARSGCAAESRSSRPTASPTRCATGSRCAAAGRPRTSRSATERTPRSDSAIDRA